MATSGTIFPVSYTHLDVYKRQLDLADEHLAALVDVQAGELCDLVRGLADDLGVEGAVDDDGLADVYKRQTLG